MSVTIYVRIINESLQCAHGMSVKDAEATVRKRYEIAGGGINSNGTAVNDNLLVESLDGPLVFEGGRLTYVVEAAQQLNNSSRKREARDDESTVAPSKASSRKVQSLLNIAGIVGVKVGEVPATTPTRSFSPLSWAAILKSDEDTKVEAAIAHLRIQLAKFLDMDPYRLANVRTKTRFFQCEVGNMGIRGTCDCVLVPADAAESGLAEAALVLFEFKLPAELQQYLKQLKVELLGARYVSNKPLLAIITDLSTQSIALQIKFNPENRTFYLTEHYLNLDQTGELLKEFLLPEEYKTVLFVPSATSVQDSALAAHQFKQLKVKPGQASDEMDAMLDMLSDEDAAPHHKRQAVAQLLSSCLGVDSSLLWQDPYLTVDRGEDYKSMFA